MPITNEEVFSVLQKVKTLEGIEYSPSLKMSGDLGIDSLDYISAIFKFEQAFDIEIPNSFEPDSDLTIEELTEHLNKYKR